MLSAIVYSVLRLLLDVVDVRLRVRDPEAELLLRSSSGPRSLAALMTWRRTTVRPLTWSLPRARVI
jgi:hypothetical protein